MDVVLRIFYSFNVCRNTSYTCAEGVYGHVYRFLHAQRGSFKAKYYRKLTRCVEVMYPPHVENMFHIHPLCTCVGTYTAVLKGCMVKNVLHLATKQGFLFNSESDFFTAICFLSDITHSSHPHSVLELHYIMNFGFLTAVCRLSHLTVVFIVLPQVSAAYTHSAQDRPTPSVTGPCCLPVLL